MALAPRTKLIKEIDMILGGSLLETDLGEDEYNLCIDLALDRYRQRSGNSMEEGFAFLDLQPEVAIYTLPDEITLVQELYRRVNGAAGGTSIDPFSLSFANNLYSIQNPSVMGYGGGAGVLSLFDFAAQYQSMAGRMFGRDLQFTFDSSTKRLVIQRKITAPETIGMHIFNIRPEEVIFKDVLAKPWIRSYAMAQAKMMIGQARSKFASLAGPQGGVTLNGEALKQEAQAELDRLEEEIKNLIDQRRGYGFTIG